MANLEKFLLPALMLSAGALFAQTKPDYFPDDVDANISVAEIRCFCKPGVRNKSRAKGLELSYQLVGRGTYKPESHSMSGPLSKYTSLQSLRFSLKVPILNKPGLKLLAGYRYVSESFAFSQFGSDFRETFEAMDQRHFKSNSIDLLFTKSIDEKRYFTFRMRNSCNGNYSGQVLFNHRYNIYKGLALFGIKRNEDHEWGFGVNFSTGFRRRTSILPFILYNRNFNPKWAIESALPAFVFMRYNLSPQTLALGGVEYNGQSYRLDVDQNTAAPLDYAFNHSEILASLQLEQQVSGWIWVNLKFGYQYNLSSDFESKNSNSEAFRVEPTNAPFIQVGVFLSPPKHFVK